MAGITHKDTTFTKLFVGGLPYHTTDDTLKAHFDQYGEIEEAVVITDRNTSKSKGYGFVTMADPESAKKAIQDPNPVIDGRKANVNLAYLGAKPRGVQALNTAALLKPGLIAPQLTGLPPFYLPGMVPGATGLQLSAAQLPLLAQAQTPISPTAAAAQYQTLADYAAYSYPALAGLDAFQTQPTAASAAYAGLTPHLSMSLPQTAAAGLAGLQFQQQLQPSDTRLQ